MVVQSAAEDRDTDYLFEIIEGVDWVGAVTAWLRLDDVGRARTRLHDLVTRPRFRGVRPLIHQEPDPHWILGPSTQGALALLEEAGILLELPVVFPNHLGDVPELARRYPELAVVIDHLGKPPLGTTSMARWQTALAAASEQPNVFAKISGLNTTIERSDWSAADLEPAVQAAFECFGASRLVFGSDWPVALLNGSYDKVVTNTVDAIRAVAGADADRSSPRTQRGSIGSPATRDRRRSSRRER